MAAVTTKLENLINPQVMADMITAKIEKKIKITPFAKIDSTLQGRPGDTITFPQFGYIGDAATIAEGVSVESVALTASSTTAKVAKAMKAVTLTDEAILSGYGNPVGETNSQLATSIAQKIDADAMDQLLKAQKFYDDASNQIKYDNIIDTIAVLSEEDNTDKVLFIHPDQMSTLRKDSNFISADKYESGVMMSGEIGMIGNARIVVTSRVKKFTEFYKFDTSGTLTIIASGSPTSSQVLLSTVTPSLPKAKTGDTVTKVSTASYFNPLVVTTVEMDESPAITIYLKRETNVETERHTLNRTTDISVDKFYAVVLSNTSKVVLARIKA